MNILSTIESLASSGNTGAVAQAASDHVSGMSGPEVEQHLSTAASNASANGQPGVAEEIGDIISKAQSNPQALKDGAIAYVKANPQVLTQFAPSFAQGILNRVG